MAVGIIRFANRSHHSLAGRALPFLAHALGGVAAPALDEGIAGENIAVDAGEIVLVQPALGPAIDLIAVIKHPAGPVGVSVVFEIRNLHAVPRLARIQILDQLIPLIEPHKFNSVFVANGNDVRDEILFVLPGSPAQVAGLVNEPGDFRPWARLRLDFLNAHTRSADKISPPAIVWLGLDFLPLVKGWTSTHKDVFAFHLGLRREHADH